MYRVDMKKIIFGLGLLVFVQILCHFKYGISNEKNGLSVEVAWVV